jgi:UDP-glucuronate 4-epimerase
MAILVTGGAGFIGSHLCEKLLKVGERVICLDNFNDYYDPKLKEANIKEATENPNFTLVRGDILDRELLEEIFSNYKIEKVAHLAAIAGVRPSILSPERYIDTDVKGTVNLLEVARRYNVRNFLFGSSSSVYGINKKVPFNEEDPTDCQISPYAAAKKSAELFCLAFHHLYKIPTVILRFFTVYGPRQRPDMAIRKFAELLMHRKPIQIFGNGTSKRDYTYIDDVIDGAFNALQREFDFVIVNLGDSKTVELKELVAIISEELKIVPEIEQLPPQPGDVPITYADISKAERLLDYRPKVYIREGIRRFIEWEKSYLQFLQ